MARLVKSDFRYVVGIIFIGLLVLVGRVLTYRSISDVLYLCFVVFSFIRYVILKVKK